jgi:hypothetical protein
VKNMITCPLCNEEIVDVRAFIEHLDEKHGDYILKEKPDSLIAFIIKARRMKVLGR